MNASPPPAAESSLVDFHGPGYRHGAGFRIVMRDVGALQILVGAIFLLPLLVSLIYGEIHSALSFLVAAVITATFGGLVYRAYRDAGEPSRRHAMLIAASGWFVSAAFGALPFVLAAYLTPAAVAQALVPSGQDYPSSLLYFRNPLHAFFESMSAFTTTGLTMAVHEPSIGHGLLFYRSLAQWVGGAGVIVLSLAIIPRPHIVGELELYQSETSGTKLRPSILGTARAIWRIYTGVTIIVAAYLFVTSLVVLPDYGWAPSLFDAINHAMTAQSTGGFSTLDDSIAGYRSYAMDLAYIPPMVLGAISIPLYYAFLRTRRLRVFWEDAQFRLMILLFVVSIPLLIMLLHGTPGVSNPIREALFQVISGVSTTGWQTSNIAAWGIPAVLFMAWGTMIVGGAAGATVGGIKLVRAYLFVRAVAWRIRRVFLPPDAIVPLRIGNRSLSTIAMHREVADAAVFSLLYIVILSGSVLIAAHQAAPQFRLGDVIFECVSAQSTVGLSIGMTDPGMPVSIELLFILQMWVGRLEVFPVIVLLIALFRRRKDR